MASFTGTAGGNTIIPGTVSGGVVVTPAGATPGGENDTIFGLAGNDNLGGSGGNDVIDGGTQNDTIDGGSGDDNLTGGDNNDSLIGGLGNDTLSGGTGDDDYVFGAADGFDSISEFAVGGLDEIRFAAGIVQSQLDFALSGNSLVITRGTLQLTIVDQFANGDGANARVERIVFSNGVTFSLTTPLAAWLNRTGDEEANQLFGSNFIDTIAGRGGDDNIFGGNDNDILSGDGGNDFVSGDAGNDRVSGNAGADNLSGGLGNDTLDGGTGNDNLSGGDGNDSLTGAAGDDFLSGGIGNDKFFVTAASGNDIISEGLSGGTDDIQFTDGTSLADLSFFLSGSDLNIVTPGSVLTVQSQYASGVGTAARVERIVFDDGTNLSIRAIVPAWLLRDGTETGEVLTGSAFNDTINGLEGADNISGSDGVDSLDGGAGNDFMQGGNGNDTLIGGAGTDFLSGGADNDTYSYVRLAGIDTVSEFAGQGNDRIIFATGTVLADLRLTVVGDDLVIAGTGGQITIADQFQTGTGANARVEQLVLGNGQVVDLTANLVTYRTQTGSASGDTINGSIFDDTLNGGDGNDFISANSGNDVLGGGDGNDNLQGGLGADTFTGGVGDDFLTGGGDANDFVFRPGDGRDSISGFIDGVDSLVFGNFGGAFNTDAEIIAAAQQVSSNVVITLPNLNGVGETVVVLFNFTLAALDGGQIDFL